MNTWELAEITTKDRLVHQGLVFIPRARSKRALLWVHGLTSTFYNNTQLLQEFHAACERDDMGFAIFNTRGHNAVTDVRKIDKRRSKGYTHTPAGAGYETFTDSTYDIQAGITHLLSRGVSEVIVCGHSTGANKVCYFAGTKRHSQVAGVVLVGPLSDRLGADPEVLARQLLFMQGLVREGRGDELLFGYHYFPITPKRFLSLMSRNSAENTFDYGDPEPKLETFSRITIPMLVVLNGADEHLDRPAEDVKATFDTYARSKLYKSIILPKALHSFAGMEADVVKVIIDWVKEL